MILLPGIFKVKDKDSRLIYEAWQDRAHAAGEEFGRSGKKAFLTPDEQTIKDVLDEHGWHIRRLDVNKWERFNDLTGEWVKVTGDEHWDIMRIEDPVKYAEYKAKI
tara:strand:- start:176 stop:493 length:318 start_codon:yes stop_codon:yes gene_type:complete